MACWYRESSSSSCVTCPSSVAKPPLASLRSFLASSSIAASPRRTVDGCKISSETAFKMNSSIAAFFSSRHSEAGIRFLLLGDSAGRQTVTQSVKNGETFECRQRFPSRSSRKFGQCFEFSRYRRFSGMGWNPRLGLSLGHYGPLWLACVR